MCIRDRTYDDVIRVADLKTRAGRSDRIAREMGAKAGNVLHLTEFMHPRAQEIVGMLPAKLGARLEGCLLYTSRCVKETVMGRYNASLRDEMRSLGLTTSKMRALAAVSYTHLDVYKRQLSGDHILRKALPA